MLLIVSDVTCFCKKNVIKKAFLALFSLIGFPILSVWYLRILQGTLLRGFTKLLSKIKRKKSGSFSSIWFTYFQLNRKLVHLCGSIEAYAQYCTSYMNILYPFYITVQCYLLYIAFFVDNFQSVQVVIAFVAVANCNLFLFSCTNECSVIAEHNSIFELLNIKFAQIEGCFFRQRKNGSACTNQRIKMESWAAHNRLHQYAFKVFANNRISSETFYIVKNK